MKRTGTFILMMLILSLWQAAAPSGAKACSCAEPPNPRVALEQSTVVFSGKVVSVNNQDAANSASRRVVTFDVNLSWKGVEKKQMVVYTGTSDADCGYAFNVGQQYIVYATADPEDETVLNTGICDRTKLFRQAGQDVAILGPGSAPAPRPTASVPVSTDAGVTNYVLPVVAGVGVLAVLFLVLSRRKRA